MNKTLILDHLEKITSVGVIAKWGSFKKAAEEINISQPSLSFKVSQLEKILNIKIFDRHPRGVRLTHKGEVLLEFVHEIFRQADELSANLDKNPKQPKGTIKVGVYDSIARYLWPEIFVSLRKKYPEIKILLSTGRTKEVFRQLLERQIDISITARTGFNQKVKTSNLYQDSFSFYISSKYLEEKSTKKSNPKIEFDLEEFLSFDFFLFSDAFSYQIIPVLSDTKGGQKVQNIHEVENFEIALEFCLQGLGISVLPNKVAQRDLTSKKIKKISIKNFAEKTTDFSMHSISLSTLKKQSDNPLVSLICKELTRLTMPYNQDFSN